MKKLGNWVLLAGAVGGAIADVGGFLPGAVTHWASVVAVVAALFAKVPLSLDPTASK